MKVATALLFLAVRAENDVHVQGQNGEDKFWLDLAIELARLTGLSRQKVNEALRIV